MLCLCANHFCVFFYSYNKRIIKHKCELLLHGVVFIRIEDRGQRTVIPLESSLFFYIFHFYVFISEHFQGHVF